MLMTCTFIFPALTSPLNSDSSIQLSASLSFPSECLLGILNVQWPDRRFCHPPKYLFPISGKSHEHLSGYSITNLWSLFKPSPYFFLYSTSQKELKARFPKQIPLLSITSLSIVWPCSGYHCHFPGLWQTLTSLSPWILCSLQPFISTL